MRKPKSAKLVQVRRASTEALKLADDLLAIACTDLRAAKLLHKNTLTAQAMFSLQQAAEKTGKAHGLAVGIAEPKDLQNDWSHNSLRLSELMADHREQQAAIKATGSAIAGTSGIPVEAIGKKTFMQSFEDPRRLAEPFLGTMVKFCRKLIVDYQAFKDAPAKQKHHEDQMVTSLVKGCTDPEKIRTLSAYGIFVARTAIESAVILPVQALLGMATLPHAIRARYPDPDRSAMYSVTNPVIKRFDELCELCEPYISAVTSFVALVRSPAAEITEPAVVGRPPPRSPSPRSPPRSAR